MRKCVSRQSPLVLTHIVSSHARCTSRRRDDRPLGDRFRKNLRQFVDEAAYKNTLVHEIYWVQLAMKEATPTHTSSKMHAGMQPIVQGPPMSYSGSMRPPGPRDSVGMSSGPYPSAPRVGCVPLPPIPVLGQPCLPLLFFFCDVFHFGSDPSHGQSTVLSSPVLI